MGKFVVHGVPGSPYVRAVPLTLEEKGTAWRLARCSIVPAPPCRWPT